MREYKRPIVDRAYYTHSASETKPFLKKDHPAYQQRTDS